VESFRVVIKGLLVTLNLDPSGEIARAVSVARYYVRQINYYSKQIAEFIGVAALVVSLIQELRQIIEWIKTLPAKVLALLQDCLATFTRGITDATSQISTVAGQVGGSLTTAFVELQETAETTVAAIEEKVVEANVPNTIIVLVTSPADANMTDVEIYYTDTYANSNVVLEQAASATYNIENTSTP
jgi:sulfur transfer complex TusBCD TusB component (DsrH family)